MRFFDRSVIAGLLLIAFCPVVAQSQIPAPPAAPVQQAAPSADAREVKPEPKKKKAKAKTKAKQAAGAKKAEP